MSHIIEPSRATKPGPAHSCYFEPTYGQPKPRWVRLNAAISRHTEFATATRAGARIPLSQLAKIEVVDGQSVIARRENRRQIAVRTNIRGRDQGSFAEEAQEKFAAQVKLPEGYRVEWGGQFDNLTRAKRRLRMVMPLTVGIIFVWLCFAFGNTKDAGIVLLNVRFSLVGGSRVREEMLS